MSGSACRSFMSAQACLDWDPPLRNHRLHGGFTLVCPSHPAGLVSPLSSTRLPAALACGSGPPASCEMTASRKGTNTPSFRDCSTGAGIHPCGTTGSTGASPSASLSNRAAARASAPRIHAALAVCYSTTAAAATCAWVITTRPGKPSAASPASNSSAFTASWETKREQLHRARKASIKGTQSRATTIRTQSAKGSRSS